MIMFRLCAFLLSLSTVIEEISSFSVLPLATTNNLLGAPISPSVLSRTSTTIVLQAAAADSGSSGRRKRKRRRKQQPSTTTATPTAQEAQNVKAPQPSAVPAPDPIRTNLEQMEGDEDDDEEEDDDDDSERDEELSLLEDVANFEFTPGREFAMGRLLSVAVIFCIKSFIYFLFSCLALPQLLLFFVAMKQTTSHYHRLLHRYRTHRRMKNPVLSLCPIFAKRAKKSKWKKSSPAKKKSKKRNECESKEATKKHLLG